MSEGKAQLWEKMLGADYAGFKVYHYEAGTSTAKDVWVDPSRRQLGPQPVVADHNGWCQFYGDGDYTLNIFDANDAHLQTLDDIRITRDTAILWENNHGVTLPAVTALNQWAPFLQVSSSDDVEDLLVQKGSEWVSLLGITGTQLINVRSATYGAVGDGVTDDTAAFEAALIAAAGSTAGGEDRTYVLVPSGTYMISRQLRIPCGVWLCGFGRNNTIIRAVAGFNFAGAEFNAFIVLGYHDGDTQIAFNTGLFNLQVDGQDEAGTSVGVYFWNTQENAGVARCIIRDFTRFAIHVERVAQGSPTHNPQGCWIYDTNARLGANAVENAADPSACIYVNNGSNVRGVDGCGLAVDADGYAFLTAGLRIEGSGGFYSRLACEHMEVGVLIGMSGELFCSGVTVIGADCGDSPMTDLVRISSGTVDGNSVAKASEGITLIGLRAREATNVVTDQVHSITSTDNVCAFHAWGAVDDDDLHNMVSTLASVRNRFGALAMPASTVTANNPGMLTRSTLYFAPTIATNFTQMASGISGQSVRVIFANSNTTVSFSAGNFRSGGGSGALTSWKPQQGDWMDCIWDETNDLWLCQISGYVRHGTAAPTADAQFVGQIWIDTNADAGYIAVATGTGASDWKQTTP